VSMSARNWLEYWQFEWARRRGVQLGPPASNPRSKKFGYVKTLEENLFEPISARVKQQFIAGAGGELEPPDGESGNMYAVYSSSALCVNLFHPWSAVDPLRPLNSSTSVGLLLEACGLPSIPVASVDFEVPQIVNPEFHTPPHLDVQISFNEGEWKCAGIEAKFCEPYAARKRFGLNPCYLREKTLWRDWSNVFAFAEKLSQSDHTHLYLNAPQLLIHLLGLKRHAEDKFALLYLWFDVPGTEEADNHRQEVASFGEILKRDGITFASRTYQEVFQFLGNCRPESEHVAYLVDRYLNAAPVGEK
jgi:hypothetical protein